MLDTLKRHLAVIVALVLAWGGWSYLEEPDGKKTAAAKSVRETIPESHLAQLEEGRAWERVVDPYRFEARVPLPVDALAGPAGTADADARASEGGGGEAAADVRPPSAWPVPAPAPTLDLLVTLASAYDAARAADRAVRLGAQRLLVRGVAIARVHAEEQARARARFSLVLESTLAGPEGGQARISGRTVRVGEAMPWLDPQDPPLLVAVSGGTAVVTHGKDRHELDLDGRRRVDVGGPPPWASGPQAMPGAPAAPTAGPPPAGAPTQPKKTSGGVRIRGSNKDKHR